MIKVLTGANSFAIRQALDAMVAEQLNKYGVHSIDRIDGESIGVDDLTNLLQGVSLFAPERLVVMRSASNNKTLWDALGEWVERVPPGVMLVLVEPSPDKRTKTYKQLQKHAEVCDFPELTEPELARWLATAAGEAGGSIDAKTSMYLVNRVSIDQWRLYTELQKLIAFNSDITVESIDQLVELNPQATAFELLDCVLRGDIEKADDLLGRLRTTEDPYRLFGLLVSQVHVLAMVVSAAGKTADSIAKEAGVHPFVVRKMQPLVRDVTQARLRELILAVARTDINLKSSSVDAWVLVEQCLGRIVSAA